jgi:serine/threonine protein kinase
MGVVYLAADPKLGRDVAIKVLDPIIGEEDDFVSRFVREATTAGGLRKHPNIITVYDAGECQNGDRTQYFIVMEYIEGEDLKLIIDQKTPIPFRQKLEMMIQMCKALHSAHSRGLVHRDVKPGNIRITSEGDVCIMDFGLAKFKSTELTGSLGVLGTPKYMSPEQTISSSNIDAQSDIFSAGLVLYEFLSGSLPFDVPDADLMGYMSAIRSTPHLPFPEAMPGVDPALSRIIDRSLAKDKSDRYKSCEEMANELTAFLSRLDSLERSLSDNLSRRGGLSRPIEGVSVPIAPNLTSLHFRPVDPNTDYGVNLQRNKVLRESTSHDPSPVRNGSLLGRFALNRRKLMLSAAAILFGALAFAVGYRYIGGESAPGTLELNVEPWAEVVSITQLKGGKQVLPEKRYTPFSMNLPGGTYAVRAVHPQLGVFEFPVEIAAGKANRVHKRFPGFSAGEKHPQ